MRYTDLIGRAKELEIASALTRNGIYTYHPLVDTGFDLVASNRSATIFIPIQVKYREKDPALNLLRRDLDRYQAPNTILAFLIGSRERLISWYIPFSEWHSRAVDKNRSDDKIYVRIGENREWLSQFEGDAGIQKTFAALLQ